MSTIIDQATDLPPVVIPAVETVPDATPMSYWYRVVWRWHFYAGIFVLPMLLMLAITGGIYLFKPQLDALMYP